MKMHEIQYFTKKEKSGLIYIAFIIGLGLVCLWVFYKYDRSEAYKMNDLIQEMKVDTNHFNKYNEEIKRNEQTPKYFSKKRPKNFDPNQVSVAELTSWGVSKYAAANLDKYRSKGGVIKSKNHFYKIYGMEAHAALLDSFVVFESKYNADIHENYDPMHKDNRANKMIQSEPLNTFQQSTQSRSLSAVRINYTELNTADSFQLENLKGIGQTLSSRIVKYRNKLGGFYDVSQLEEVYGLKPETYQSIERFITINADYIVKLNVNTVDEHHLARHPYIGRKLASIIIRYRNQHGKYNDWDDLRKIKVIDEAQMQKLQHYISF